MIRLIRWLFGYVVFEFSGGFAEGLINTCYEYGIGIFNIERSSNGIRACCPAKKYKQLCRAAKINGGKIKIIKRRGIVFRLSKLKRRWGLFVGIVLFVAIINFLSGFVWDIQIEGNSEITDQQILAILDENDFRIGTYWDSINKSSLEALIMASLDKCAWVSINQEGCTAHIEINESIDKPKIAQSNPSNLKAKKDGVIVSTVTYDGWQVVKAGEGVTKGEILVSGIYEGETTGVTLFAHAKGDFVAQVNESISITTNRIQKSKSYTSNKEYKTLLFFGIKIPLYLGSYNTIDTDVQEDYSYIKLNNKTIPIGVCTTTVSKYQVVDNVLSDEELTQLARQREEEYISTEFKNYEIISQNTEIIINEDNAQISGTIICLEDIGKEVPISVVTTDEETDEQSDKNTHKNGNNS